MAMKKKMKRSKCTHYGCRAMASHVDYVEGMTALRKCAKHAKHDATPIVKAERFLSFQDGLPSGSP